MSPRVNDDSPNLHVAQGLEIAAQVSTGRAGIRCPESARYSHTPDDYAQAQVMLQRSFSSKRISRARLPTRTLQTRLRQTLWRSHLSRWNIVRNNVIGRHD